MLQSGVGVVEALATQHGVSVEVAQAIFDAGKSSGEMSRRSSARADSKPDESSSRSNCSSSEPTGFAFETGQHITLEQLRNEQAIFAREREWDQFHTPRNLALALVGEVGELCEIFQWKVSIAEFVDMVRLRH
jgi:hypothetical protein